MPGLAHLQAKIINAFHLSGVNANALRALGPVARTFKKGDVLIYSDTPCKEAYLISAGWAVCYRLLANGCRQVVNILLPGDFACLSLLSGGVSDYCIEARTDLSVIAFIPGCLKDFLSLPGKVGDIALCAIAQEKAIITEHLTSVGQRTARERLLHLALELRNRLRHAGTCDSLTFFLPIRQHDLAHALALSDVHLSRTVKAIRDEELCDINFLQRSVRILDLERAQRACDFDASYLSGPNSQDDSRQPNWSRALV
jgi:CRP-like cAMP-binding protein